MKQTAIAFLTLLLFAGSAAAQGISIRGLGNRGRVETPRTKTIHGTVVDQNGKPIVGASVYILNTKDSISRTVSTDAKGSYSLSGLTFDVNYEVRADFRGSVSDLKSISGMLDREDNLVNFELKLLPGVSGGSTTAAPADPGPELQAFDLTKLKASFEMPQGVPAPIPAILLLHGYGENRKVWEGFRKQFLDQGWAVMSLDLRGHGDSTIKNQRPIQPSPEWRSNPREFPQDVAPALDWLKRQPRLNSSKIVIIGYDVGANLALVTSGKVREVRTVIAVKPNAKESLELAGSAQDFKPRSALVVVENAAQGEEFKSYVGGPFRTLVQPVAGGTAQTFQNKTLSDAIFQWLKETY